MAPARILIEARPGAGKSTALARTAALLRERGVRISGFITEEIREAGRRVGFSIEDLSSGERGTLAHVRLTRPPRVGRYGVDLEEFERLALPALDANAQAVLIDELGKMELASEAFRSAFLELLRSRTPVAATVHAFRHPFTDELKKRADTELVRLTSKNRDELPEYLAARLQDEADGAPPAAALSPPLLERRPQRRTTAH